MSGRHRVPSPSWWTAAIAAMRRVEPVPGACEPVVPAQRNDDERLQERTTSSD